MKRLMVIALIFASLGIVVPLSAQEGKSFDGTIRIGGSTTMLPVVADAASNFMERYKTWNKVDPSLPNVPVLIYVTAGGSGFGIKAVGDGTVQIGMSSRDLSEKEKSHLGDHREVLLSKDCIAFAVNKKSPLARKDNLTRQEVSRIFSGEAKTFRDLDPTLPAKPILVQMRDAAGGSTEIIQKEILRDRTFAQGAIQVPSQGANLKKLETNANTIGYLSSVIALQSKQLKVFRFEGIAPTNENVINGAYQLTRPLLLIVKGTPEAPVQKFIDFLLTDGQRGIADHGYVPVKAVR